MQNAILETRYSTSSPDFVSRGLVSSFANDTITFDGL